jgi:hypothetical protein
VNKNIMANSFSHTDVEYQKTCISITALMMLTLVIVLLAFEWCKKKGITSKDAHHKIRHQRETNCQQKMDQKLCLSFE